MEEVDDDMLVVIIGNDNDDERSVNDFQPVEIKQEYDPNITCDLGVEELIETAEKHGEYVEMEMGLKEEPINCQSEFIGGELLEAKVECLSDYADEDENTTRESDNDVEYLDKPEQTKRCSMLKPHQRKSYVQTLIKENPKLKNNETELIRLLYEMMKAVQRPELKNYYIENGFSYECVKCGASSETIQVAARHYQEKHGSRYLICYACGVDFRSTTNLFKHEKRCNAPDAVLVLKARAMYVGLKGRSRPFLVDAKKIPRRQQLQPVKTLHSCEMCSAVFWSKATLQSHMHLHSGIRPYRCDVCPAAYTSNSALARHRSKHEDNKFICDYCSRSFKVKATLTVHLNTHLPQKKYGCETCGRRYAQKMALTLHVNRAHRRLPPPCACEICNKRYPRMSLLKSHMLKEHGLVLMTRNMFFKSLPTMSDIDLNQTRNVLKNIDKSNNNTKYTLVDAKTGNIVQQNEYIDYDVRSLDGNMNVNSDDNDITETITQDTVSCTQEVNTELEDGNAVVEAEESELSQEVLQYIHGLQQSNEEGVKFVIIQDGNVVNVGDDTVLNEEHLEALHQAGFQVQVKTEVEDMEVEEMYDENKICEGEKSESQYEMEVSNTKDELKASVSNVNEHQKNMPLIEIELTEVHNETDVNVSQNDLEDDRIQTETETEVDKKPNYKEIKVKDNIEQELEIMHSDTVESKDLKVNSGNTGLAKQFVVKVDKVPKQQIVRAHTRSAAKNEREKNVQIVTRSGRKLTENQPNRLKSKHRSMPEI